MAVAFDAKMTGGNSSDGFNQQVSSATSISSTGITLGGSASFIVAGLVWGGSSSPTTAGAMTWNGVSMVAGPTITSSGGGSFSRCSIFGLVSPATGNHTLAGSWTGSGDCYMWAVSFSGTDTTTGWNVTDHTTASQVTTITVPSTTDGATVACFGVDGATPTVNFTKLFAEAPLNPGGGANYTLGGTSNAHTFTGAGGTRQALVGVHVISSGGGGGGRTLFTPAGLDGLSTSGAKQFNPSLGYHRTPAISLEAYRREQAAKHRDFMRRVVA